LAPGYNDNADMQISSNLATHKPNMLSNQYAAAITLITKHDWY